AAGRIVGAHPDARFLVARAPTVDAAELGDKGVPPLRIVAGRTYTVMRAADLLLVTSGTATLEAALLGTPMVVCYRLSRLSELLFKPLVRVPWISLANIALGRAVVPELYQRGLTGQALGREALRLLDSPAALAGQREACGELAGRGRPARARAGQPLARGPADGGLRAALRARRRARVVVARRTGRPARAHARDPRRRGRGHGARRPARTGPPAAGRHRGAGRDHGCADRAGGRGRAARAPSRLLGPLHGAGAVRQVRGGVRRRPRGQAPRRPRGRARARGARARGRHRRGRRAGRSAPVTYATYVLYTALLAAGVTAY